MRKSLRLVARAARGCDPHRPPGADGLLFLPYLQGERTPNLPNGTGVLHGLTTRTMTPAHLARATMEGVTLGLAYGPASHARARYRAHGNPAHRRRQQKRDLRKICADVFGCRVVTSPNPRALRSAPPSRRSPPWRPANRSPTGPTKSSKSTRRIPRSRPRPCGFRLLRRDGKTNLPDRRPLRPRVPLISLFPPPENMPGMGATLSAQASRRRMRMFGIAALIGVFLAGSTMATLHAGQVSPRNSPTASP